VLKVSESSIDDIQVLKEMLKEPNRFSKQKLAESVIKWVEFANKLALEKEELKEEYRKGWENKDKELKHQQKEYQALYSSIAECDEIMDQQQKEIRRLTNLIKELETYDHSGTVGLKKAPYDDIDDA
jgi:uncharacterized coiled-coil protein SlyX